MTQENKSEFFIVPAGCVDLGVFVALLFKFVG